MQEQHRKTRDGETSERDGKRKTDEGAWGQEQNAAEKKFHVSKEKGSPMGIRMNSILAQSKWLALPAACCFLAFSAPPADQRIVAFQESGGVPENAKVLVGHWRKTTIGYVGPRDEHLVLHADGRAENWVVTASSQTERTTGQWSVEGKTLKLSFGDNENSRPFTIYEGQLVFPDIPNRRQFWEKIE
jgi:hypothetical protein